MTQVTDALLEQMVQAIVDEVDPEQVILFGSRAEARSGRIRTRSGGRGSRTLRVLDPEPAPRRQSGSGGRCPALSCRRTSLSTAETRPSVGAARSTTFWRGRSEREGCSMSDVKCARVMYRAAERDVLTLRSMTADAPVESFGFHVQQAAEKALKAWLALLGESILSPTVSRRCWISSTSGAPPWSLSAA